MSIRRPAAGSRSREQLRELFVAGAYDTSALTNGELSLAAILGIRSELLAGRREIEMVDPATAARLLGDRDAILGYAESLAAEAAARRHGGDGAAAQRLEARAMAVALVVPGIENDGEASELVAELRRRAETIARTT